MPLAQEKVAKKSSDKYFLVLSYLYLGINQWQIYWGRKKNRYFLTLMTTDRVHGNPPILKRAWKDRQTMEIPC
jgi:hypothetical protein